VLLKRLLGLDFSRCPLRLSEIRSAGSVTRFRSFSAADQCLRYVCRACANYSAASDCFFSPDGAGKSTAVRVRSFAPNTITWMCGYFCLSSKAAFDAASAVSYWDLTLPSTSKPYPSTGNTLALRFLGLASSSLTCFSIIVLFKRSALKAVSFVSSLTPLSNVFRADKPHPRGCLLRANGGHCRPSSRKTASCGLSEIYSDVCHG
jgi:hypothetical protein